MRDGLGSIRTETYCNTELVDSGQLCLNCKRRTAQ